MRKSRELRLVCARPWGYFQSRGHRRILSSARKTTLEGYKKARLSREPGSACITVVILAWGTEKG